MRKAPGKAGLHKSPYSRGPAMRTGLFAAVLASLFLIAPSHSSAKTKLPEDARAAIDELLRVVAKYPTAGSLLADLKKRIAKTDPVYDKKTQSHAYRFGAVGVYTIKGKTAKNAYLVLNSAYSLGRNVGIWTHATGLTFRNIVFSYVSPLNTKDPIPLASLPSGLRHTVGLMFRKRMPVTKGWTVMAGVDFADHGGSMIKTLLTAMDGNLATGAKPLAAPKPGAPMVALLKAKNPLRAKKHPLKKRTPFVLRTGFALSPLAALRGKKPTGFIELRRPGQWNDPLGMKGVSLYNATFYFDQKSVFGMWGNLRLGKEQITVSFRAPVGPVKSKSAYLKAEFGFGAEQISAAALARLLGNLSDAGLATANDINDAVGQKAFSAISEWLRDVPDDLLVFENPKWPKKYQFHPLIEFPPADAYNLLLLGPRAQPRTGFSLPGAKLHGQLKVRGKRVVGTNLRVDKDGMRMGLHFETKAKLGTIGGVKLGTVGNTGVLRLNLNEKRQFFGITGKLHLGDKYGTVPYTMNVKGDLKSELSAKATCLMPFGLTGGIDLAKQKTFAPKDFVGLSAPNLKLVFPRAKGRKGCWEKIYYMSVGKYLYAYNEKGTIAKALGEQVFRSAIVTRVPGRAWQLYSGSLRPGGEAAAKAAKKAGGALAKMAKQQAKKALEAAEKRLADAKKQSKAKFNDAKKEVKEIKYGACKVLGC